MAGIQLSGLASGLDTEAVITQLMALERAPRSRMELRQAATQARSDSLREIATRLTSLRSAAKELSSVTTWAATQSTESSDTTKVAAKRTGGAAPGGTTITVNSLATASQRTFDFTEQAGASSITIGAVSVPLAAGAKLADAVSAVNNADAGVYAIDVGGKLVLSSKTTGGGSVFTAAGAGLSNEVQRDGADASITIGATTTPHASNVLTDVIPGIELTLRAPGTVTVLVGAPAPDATAVEAKVKAFVESYNATVDLVRGKLNERRMPTAATLADARKGSLFNDTNLAGTLRSLRSIAGDGLSALGVSTGAATGTSNADAVAGKLTFDPTKLTTAMAAGPAAVKTALEGFATSMEAALAPLAQAGGVLEGRIGSATSELMRFKNQLAKFDDRLIRREDQLRKQFTALESALSKSNSVSADLAARLGTTS